MPETEPESVTYRVSTLPTVLSLWPQHFKYLLVTLTKLLTTEGLFTMCCNKSYQVSSEGHEIEDKNQYLTALKQFLKMIILNT